MHIHLYNTFVAFSFSLSSYEKLSLYGSAKNVEISDLITEIEGISEKFSDEKSAVGESILIVKGIINSLK